MFFISIATVRGPTPPGTGVAMEHCCFSYSGISPVNLLLWGDRLIPMSIAIDFGFNTEIRFGLPTAEIRMSA